MTREEYTIRGAHVGGGAGIQDPGMLALEMHLIECSDKTILVPHGSLLGDVERRKCRRGLRRHEGRVSLRRRGAKHAWAPVALLSRRRALWRPWIVANPGAHGSVLAVLANRLGRACNAAALLRRAAVPATPALALALATAAVATAAALVAAAVAGHVWVVCTSRGGCGSESTTPARAGAARPGGGEEGGAGDRLFIVWRDRAP